MNNSGYKIEDSQIQVGQQSQPKTPPNPVLPYTIIYPYGRKTDAIGVRMDSDVLFYSDIHPGEPVSRETHLSISKDVDLSYSVSIYEDHQLQSSDSADLIPDTHCDNGVCSASVPDLWANPLTFGFGYRCQTKSEGLCSQLKNDKNLYFSFSHEATYPPFLSTLEQKNSSSEIDFILKANRSPSSSQKQLNNSIFIRLSPNL